MSVGEILKSAVKALKAKKGRTALTMLGIIIGITSIILIMSLGQGAQDLILNQIQGQVGSKVIEVAPGREPEGMTDFLSLFSDSLKQKDLEVLQKKINVPHLQTIMPLVFGSETTSYGSETYGATVYGMTQDAGEIYSIYPGEGRFFTEDEVKNSAEVVVIGSRVKEELFLNNEAIGQKIKIKGRNFKVIGILEKKGQGMLIGFDETVIVPYTTAQQYILGIKYFNHLIVEADSEENVPQTVEDIKITLRNSHNITDPEKDDFHVSSQADAMETVSTITNILTFFLAAVAAISLLVGGIGIMNIMLVSVTERTREIGLRKAVGATNKDILTQFLFESVILTVFGGAVGIGLGILWSLLGAAVISYFLGQPWPSGISLFSILLGFGVSAFIGMVFGIFPAQRASKLNPIEALRYE